MDGASQPLPYRLSLVLPAFNEEAGIRQAVLEADDALAGLVADYEVLVVDDGSCDGTAAVVEEIAASRSRVRLLRHGENRGYGAALRTGFEAASFELVAFTDADCQFHLADLGRLLPLTDRCPVVVGYREDRQDPWRRRFLSRGYNLLARTLLGTRVRDVDCALKVFRRDALAKLLPESAGFFVNTEMLSRARQHRLPIAEVGVRHRPRLRGASKVSLGEVPRTLGALLPFWWSRVLLAGRDGPAGRQPSAWPALALLLVVSALLFLTRLRAPLLEPQEARYAEIPRQMLAEGRFVVPVLHGQAYLDKPPLLYWLVMASYHTFGVSDWAARLVPGLAGVLTVLLAYLWGRRALGHRAALWGALVLCLSARFVYFGRMLTMDGLLALWVTASLASIHCALLGNPQSANRNPQWGWWLLSAAACALGVLTKGPVALVLVGVPVVLYRLLDPRCPRLSWRHGLAYVAVVVALAGPWFVAAACVESDFAGYFFWTHNVVRFLAPFDHAEPVWYFVPGLLLGLLPWTLLLPGLVRFLGRRPARSAARRPPALGFCLLAFLSAFAFFSASGCKRPAYILPALPPLALSLGCYLDAVLAHGALLRRGSRLAFPAAAVSLAAALVLVCAGAASRLLPPTTAVVLATVLLAGTAALVLARRAVTWPVVAGCAFVMLLAGIQVLLPEYHRHFALREHLRAHVGRGGGERVTVICYPQRWDSVSFYLPGAEVKVFSAGERARLFAALRDRPRMLLAAKSGRSLEDVLRGLPEDLEFVSGAKDAAVVVGWVRPRPLATDGRLAEK
jgi:dolichol-phosphate mannosyltransferase